MGTETRITDSEKRWHVHADGRQTGPFTADAIAAGLAEGQYPPGASFSSGGPWMTAAQFTAARGASADVRRGPVLPPPPRAPGTIPAAGPALASKSNVAATMDLDPPIIGFADEPEVPARRAPADPPPLPLPLPVQASVAPDPIDIAPEDGAPPERDRIVVLGRRQSGKTIFLATTYAKLWKSADGMTAKALTGEAHKQLMLAHQQLADGQWPPSTLGTSQMDWEIEYHGKTRLLVALDFAGELFSRAFVDEQTDWPGVKELVNHIDRAAAVILLVDPSVVAGMDPKAAMDDDFGLVQAVQRIRNWPGGEDVPVVLVLTKMDQHQALLDRFGGPMEFVRRHFRALLRILKEVPIMQVSAVQVGRDQQGRLWPRKDSTPINVQNPLRFCLRAIEKIERRSEVHQVQRQQQVMQAQTHAMARERVERDRKNALWAIGGISLVGTTLLGLILYFNI